MAQAPSGRHRRNIQVKEAVSFIASAANRDFKEIARARTNAQSMVVPVLFTGGDKAIAIKDDAAGFSTV